MDPEQTFLRVHARLSGVLLRVLTPNIRTALEYHHFAVAVALSCSVVVMHTNFVQQPGCSAELLKIKIGGADLVHIKISSAGLWSPTKSASSLIETLEKNNLADSLIIRNADGDGAKCGACIPARELLKSVVYRLSMKCSKILTFPWGIRQKHAGSDISSEFSKLPPLLQLKNLQSLMGYLYNFQTREIYDLGHPHEQTERSNKFKEYFVAKCGVLIMPLFVFFTTTMSVSFTSRETQYRMLKFTVQLQHHARHCLPTFQLVFVHVIESLVFVAIMIVTLFFLFEFYDDQLLAFMVLILVWLCELFTLISVRTPLSISSFHAFSCSIFWCSTYTFHTYDFSCLAFTTTAAFCTI